MCTVYTCVRTVHWLQQVQQLGKAAAGTQSAYPNPVPLRLAVFHRSANSARAFVKATATAPKNSAAAQAKLGQLAGYGRRQTCIELPEWARDRCKCPTCHGAANLSASGEVGGVVNSVHLCEADQSQNCKCCTNQLQVEQKR